MSTTNDFKKWLSNLNFDGSTPDEIEALYYCIRNVEGNSIFNCEHLGNERYLISCSFLSEKLLIVSDKQKTYLLDYLEDNYAGGDVEANAGYHRAINKKD